MSQVVHSLEARYYTDPAIFENEKQGLFAKTWQFVVHASSIPKVGDYHTFELAGESLFCVRDKAGKVRTYYNVCQHRAHQLVQGEGNTRMLVCPYHAWTYDWDGQMTSGPATKRVPGFDKSKVCLTSVATEDFHGFIFVNLDKDAASMDEWYPGVREEIGAWVPHIANLQPQEYVAVAEKCNWKVAVENYSECYHCPKNHPTFVKGVVKPETYDIQPDKNQGYVLRHTTECQSLETMTYPIDLDSNEYAGRYQSWFLWPTFSFQCYPGNVLNTYVWRADDVDNCTAIRGWYTEHGEESQVIRELAIQDRETTVQEDIRLVESVQRGLKCKGYVPGPLVLDPKGGVMSEHSIAALQGWMREAVE